MAGNVDNCASELALFYLIAASSVYGFAFRRCLRLRGAADTNDLWDRGFRCGVLHHNIAGGVALDS